MNITLVVRCGVVTEKPTPTAHVKLDYATPERVASRRMGCLHAIVVFLGTVFMASGGITLVVAISHDLRLGVDAADLFESATIVVICVFCGFVALRWARRR